MDVIPGSSFDTLETCFRLLTSGPAPLTLDGRHVGHGLPARPIPLGELRVLLQHPPSTTAPPSMSKPIYWNLSAMRSARAPPGPSSSPLACSSSPTSAIHPPPVHWAARIRLGHERSRAPPGGIAPARRRQQLGVCGSRPAAQRLALSLGVVAARHLRWEPSRGGPGGSTPIPVHADQRAACQHAPNPPTPGHPPTGRSTRLRRQPATTGHADVATSRRRRLDRTAASTATAIALTRRHSDSYSLGCRDPGAQGPAPPADRPRAARRADRAGARAPSASAVLLATRPPPAARPRPMACTGVAGPRGTRPG